MIHTSTPKEKKQNRLLISIQKRELGIQSRYQEIKISANTEEKRKKNSPRIRQQQFFGYIFKFLVRLFLISILKKKDLICVK
jgi:hypothetical protein